MRPKLFSAQLFSCCALCIGFCAQAVEWRGLVDARAVLTDTGHSWTGDGLGKTRYDRTQGKLRLGQAFLRIDGDVLDTITVSAAISANDDRRSLLDINEVWLAWNPVPTSPWKTRVKVGAFFPVTSLEIDYDSIGWTPARTISSSAINSWIGEELRTNGIEFSLARNGRLENSPHNFGLTAALFNGNDPAGTLLAWRGWSLSDRITGIHEPIRLTDLPAYRSNGPLNKQDRNIHPFREIDNTPGYYLGAHYGYAGSIELAALHYDNRGDPLVVKNGQYSWQTRFDHLSLRWRPGSDWELLFQALRGSTLMGPNAVHLDYQAWYALASHPLGSGKLTARYDRFKTNDLDSLPADPNGEDGHGFALAYRYPYSKSLSFIAELLMVRSNRAARTLIGEVPDQTERSATTALRWQF